jgi:Ca-activated chloride channel family protein
VNAAPGALAENRGRIADRELAKGDDKDGKGLAGAKEKKTAYDQAREALRRGARDAVQAGKLGVDLSVQMQNLRAQARLEPTALRNVQGRNLMEVGGVWIDEGFGARQKALVVRAQSDAYFRMLERRPELKHVFSLGNHLVWVTPSQTALVLDTTEGKDTLSDGEIDALFAAAK